MQFVGTYVRLGSTSGQIRERLVVLGSFLKRVSQTHGPTIRHIEPLVNWLRITVDVFDCWLLNFLAIIPH